MPAEAHSVVTASDTATKNRGSVIGKTIPGGDPISVERRGTRYDVATLPGCAERGYTLFGVMSISSARDCAAIGTTTLSTVPRPEVPISSDPPS